MSLYLAIDTATDTGSVAVGQPGAIASEVLVGARRRGGTDRAADDRHEDLPREPLARIMAG